MPDLDSNSVKPGEPTPEGPTPPPEFKVPLATPAPPAEKTSSPPKPPGGLSSYRAVFSEAFPSPPKVPTPAPTDNKTTATTLSVSFQASPPEDMLTPLSSPKNEELTTVPSPFSPEAPSASPPSSPPPPEVKSPPSVPGVDIAKPHSPILTLLLFIFGALILGGLIFAGWKFLLPMLPAGIKPGGVTLTYWGLWEDDNILRPIIEDYEKSHRGIKIDYKKQTPQEYRERLQTALSQEKGPDIFRFHNTWVPMLRNDLSSVPGSVFSSGDFQKTFYPVAVKDLKQGDAFYGIPLEIDGLSLLYNEDIFKAAGVSPPTTWEQFKKAAYTLTVRDANKKIQTAGVALGITNNVDHWSDILGMMLLQNGADLYNPKGNLAEDALFFFTSFAQGENRVWDETLPPSTLAFSQGKVAMVFVPSWQILAIKNKNPKLNFKVLPLPQLPGINITWASYWVEGVAIKGAHQAEAWEFLKYLSQKETLVKFYTEAAKTRLFGEPYGRQDLAASLKDDPYVGPYVQQAGQAKSFYLASQTFDNGINSKMIKYFEDAVNSVNQGVSPRSALDTAGKGIQQVLATYGITAPAPAKR